MSNRGKQHRNRRTAKKAQSTRRTTPPCLRCGSTESRVAYCAHCGAFDWSGFITSILWVAVVFAPGIWGVLASQTVWLLIPSAVFLSLGTLMIINTSSECIESLVYQQGKKQYCCTHCFKPISNRKVLCAACGAIRWRQCVELLIGSFLCFTVGFVVFQASRTWWQSIPSYLLFGMCLLYFLDLILRPIHHLYFRVAGPKSCRCGATCGRTQVMCDRCGGILASRLIGECFVAALLIVPSLLILMYADLPELRILAVLLLLLGIFNAIPVFLLGALLLWEVRWKRRIELANADELQRYVVVTESMPNSRLLRRR